MNDEDYLFKDSAKYLLESKGFPVSEKYHKRRVRKLANYIEENGIANVKLLVNKRHDYPTQRGRFRDWIRLGECSKTKMFIWAVVRK